MNKRKVIQRHAVPAYIHPGNFNLGSLKIPSLQISSPTANPVLDKLLVGADISMPYSDQTWEQLEAVYQSIAASIITIGKQIAVMVKKIQEVKAESPSLVTIVKATDNDLTTYVKRLKSQHDKHKKYTGRVRNGNDLDLCLALFQQYQDIQQAMFDVLEPNISLLGEILQNHEDKLKQQEQAAQQAA